MAALLHRFGRFAVVGALATAVHAAVFTVGIEALRLDPVVATAAAFCVATLVGFALNRHWTFAITDAPTTRLGRYAVAATVGLGMNVAIMYIVVHMLGGSPYIGLGVAIVLVPPVTFSLSHFWVFRKQPQAS